MPSQSVLVKFALLGMVLAACNPACSKEPSARSSYPTPEQGGREHSVAGAQPGSELEHRAAPSHRDDADVFAQRRAALVEQLGRQGIEDERVLRALREVPRHELVPEDQKGRAYQDRPLPIGQDQTISQPYIVALMTQLARLDTDHRVLEVGTGSGYQAAVLAKIASQVYTIEIVESLALRAQRDLRRLGLAENIHFRVGDGYAGWAEAAPFDAIVVTAAPREVPGPLIEQLAMGGRLVIPVGERRQELRVLERTPQGLTEKGVVPVRFVPMTGRARDGR